MISTQSVDRMTGGEPWPDPVTHPYCWHLFGLAIAKTLAHHDPTFWTKALLAGYVTDPNLREWLRGSNRYEGLSITALKDRARLELQ
jgi:hypothetical protein